MSNNQRVFFPLGGIPNQDAGSMINFYEWVDREGIEIVLTTPNIQEAAPPGSNFLPPSHVQSIKIQMTVFYGAVESRERFAALFGFSYSIEKSQDVVEYVFDNVLNINQKLKGFQP